jgi:hypothetical protein
MCVKWQGMSIVDMRQADKATRIADDSVTKCQERTDAIVTLDYVPCNTKMTDENF